MRPDTAMVFAAGHGTRMAPLSDTTPKPMVRINGLPMIDFALDRLAGMRKVAVNTHYLAEQLEQHLAKREGVICIREEPDILDTGGGLRNALPVLGSNPVLTMNCDMVFSGQDPVELLLRTWNGAQMDALLVLIRHENTIEHSGPGDFFLDDSGVVSRRANHASAPYVYSGLQIIKTQKLHDVPSRVFSLNLLWDQMIAKGSAFGVVFEGNWVDVGHPRGVVAAEQVLADV